MIPDVGLNCQRRPKTVGVAFEKVEHDNVAVLKVSGNLDTSTAKQLKKALADMIQEERYNIVVDLQKVAQINYMGVGTLLERLRQVRKFDGDLRLAGLNKLTRKCLSMVGASKVFAVFVNEDEAVASFAPTQEDARAVAVHAQ
ncbi:MAG: anti-sigma factor antagonist [Candidatus Abyssobacteria bacterium SURF_5]|uniref:Anti-sigma factor antagonist n=1 Tax=Abyssobacteria bacterium (strain SURF_5) TaxID=2093360 RepID=A0A3A4P314_ABYX5|nr:MAG: anti-sigma factor antagonist [Candidatus Abyssubacteria bacterium SURF_5]